MNPSKTITVALVGSRIGAASPTCDPAFDLDAPGIAAALTRYERERSDEALAAIPLRPDARPVLFKVAPLSTRAARIVGETDGVRSIHTTVALACHEYTNEHGATTTAASFGTVQQTAPGVTLAPDEWVEHLHDTFGGDALSELAKVVKDRTEAGPRALAPFRLPRGLMLAR